MSVATVTRGGRRGAAGLTEAHVQFEQRCQPEAAQRDCMCGLGRHVTGAPPIDGTRRQLIGNQCRSGHHDAVEDDRCAPHGRLGENPAMAAKSAPPTAATSDRDRRRGGDRATYRRGWRRSADPPRIVDPGAAPDHDDRFVVGQQSDEDRGGSGVPDAHVTGDKQVDAGIDQLVGDGPSGGNRLPGFGERDRVGDSQVVAAAADLPRHRRRGVGDDGDVLDAHRGARASGQDIDRGPAGDEVGHHLLGDHLREG